MISYKVIIYRFLIGFIITVVIESITVYLASVFLAKKYKKKSYAIANPKDFFLLGILPSALTLPYLWFVISFFITDAIQRIVVGEMIVVIAETILLKLLSQYNLKICLALSILANFNSLAIGRLLVSIFKLW